MVPPPGFAARYIFVNSAFRDMAVSAYPAQLVLHRRQRRLPLPSHDEIRTFRELARGTR